MTKDSKTTDPATSPHVLSGIVDTTREGQQHHPMAGPSDAEKYRWMRANRGNVGIVDALARCDRGADFDDRIAAEMAMSAAGMRTYQRGSGHS